MNTSNSSRRAFLEASLLLAVPTVLAGQTLTPDPVPASKRLKVACVGGHPDDPESGCAGTLARYAQAGHSVTVVYLTRGERGIRGKTNEEAAAIRTGEAEAACKILGAKPVFAGQVDGSTELSAARILEMQKLLAAEDPDLVFTHWPIDTHPDHQVASILTIRAYFSMARRAQLYLFEVNTGSQSEGFVPNTYVDISSVLELKKSALFAHASQDGSGIWKQHHEPIASFRGREAGVGAAEAFFHLARPNPASRLPGT
jgi:LmbE family N-acetylglucosaminyl deacetylase